MFPQLAPSLQKQLQHFLDVVDVLNTRRVQPRPDAGRERLFLSFVFTHYIASRDERVADVASEEVQELIAQKRRLFPLDIPYLMICLDGRVYPMRIAGLQGRILKSGAGDFQEFVPRRTDGHLMLPPDALLAQIIFGTMDASAAGQVFEVLDSHVGCAARNAEEQERTNRADIPDNGLRADVLRKKEMGEALQRLVQQKYHGTKRLVVAQTSFDPRTGFLYMGLEKDECLQDPAAQQDGYTSVVLQRFLQQGRIIATDALLDAAVRNGRTIRDVFAQYVFPVSYTTRYRADKARFWKAMTAMHGAVQPVIAEKLRSVFSHLRQPDSIPELQERTTLLLANMFSAYLLTPEQRESEEKHIESIIVRTYSAKLPYMVAQSFSIDPANPNFFGNVALGAKLIIGNRRAGNMSAVECREVLEKLYAGDRDALAQASIPFIQSERIEADESSDDLTAVQQADWSDLVAVPWVTMTDTAFEQYLVRKVSNISAITVRAINNLRHLALRLYRSSLRDRVYQGQIVPLSLLAAPNGKTLAILPFVTPGFDEPAAAA